MPIPAKVPMDTDEFGALEFSMVNSLPDEKFKYDPVLLK